MKIKRNNLHTNKYNNNNNNNRLPNHSFIVTDYRISSRILLWCKFLCNFIANQILNNVRCLCHCYSMFIISLHGLFCVQCVFVDIFDLSVWFDEQPFSHSARVLNFNCHTFYVTIKFHYDILNRLNFGSHPFEEYSLVFLRHARMLSHFCTFQPHIVSYRRQSKIIIAVCQHCEWPKLKNERQTTKQNRRWKKKFNPRKRGTMINGQRATGSEK